MITQDELDQIRAGITVYRVVDGVEVDRKLAFPTTAMRVAMHNAATDAARALGQMGESLRNMNNVFVKAGLIK